MDCGPACLRMIAKHYGKSLSLEHLRKISEINREGVTMLGISQASEKIGFQTSCLGMPLDMLKQVDLPVILHWNQNHFVVLYKITNKRYYVADPALGNMTYTREEFAQRWIPKSETDGVVLLIKPSADFFSLKDDEKKDLNIKYFLGYLLRYKQLIFQIIIGLGAGSLFQIILPFLTQSIVDIGIRTKDLTFINIILIAQSVLFLGRMSADFIRSWILLHISARLNISILTDFLIKLMKLPMSFFDTKMTGDIMQRMNDQRRIETFLTGPALNIIFSVFNLLVFTIVLSYYNLTVFSIFLISSCAYSIWIVFFLKKRRVLDFKRFDISAKNQNSIMQLVNGIQDIKLNNCEKQKRWEWERIQAKLFRFNMKSLALGQYQQLGTFFINEGKNLLITYIAAKSVINGSLTLGEMMAVQYIVAQLNNPIEQLLSFIQQLQDAKISLERLNEIREIDDEDQAGKTFIQQIPQMGSLCLNEITFTYPGAGNKPVLKNINIEIPEGKTTAIVGMSGSGKTTILKLLLRFYLPQKGSIKIGDVLLDELSFEAWRAECGVVMQEGFIFSDSIVKNIAVGDENPDPERLSEAIKIANLVDFVSSMPMGINTLIGTEGNGISQGQKQRILIARAVYKNPKYIFFDEATNSLDANNERVIMENLDRFFKGRTVVVVAHRLSTVKNADNIIVLDNGHLVEQGAHSILSKSHGEYYELVKNQLELGN